MKVRSVAPLALALTVLGASAAQAQNFGYAPGTQKYRITQSGKIAMEAMGQRQEMENGSRQLLTVTLAPQTKDTLAFAMTLDSMTMVQQIPGAPDLSTLQGAKVTALMSPLGQMYSIKTPEGLPGGEQLDDMARFLPRLRSSLAVGQSWTDTTTRKQNTQGIDIERTTVTTNKVVGEDVVDGEKVWKIERTAATKMTGSGTTQGQPVSMEGTVGSTGTLLVSPKGFFVGGESKDDAKLKITLVANGMEIAQNINTTTKIERAK
jgi:hypothetical protein